MGLLKFFRKLDLRFGKLFRTGFENCSIRIGNSNLFVFYNDNTIKEVLLDDIIEIKYDQDLGQESSYPVWIINSTNDSIIIPYDAKEISQLEYFISNLRGYDSEKFSLQQKIDGTKPIQVWSKF